MSFLSFEFVLFVVAGLFVFHLAPGRFRRHVLLALSYAFYLNASAFFALLLFGSTAVVYIAAHAVARIRSESDKLRLTILSVALLVVVLVGFKCAGQLMETVQAHWATTGANFAMLLVVPLGLSYYLLKLIGYLLDVYWETIPAENSLVSMALYVAFFPQIVSGPIQRAGDFFLQVENLGRPDPAEISAGLRRILFGLAKKFLIADPLSVVVAAVHANPSGFSSLELLIGAYCFAIQLYADFSALTDIAIGLGQLFGVKGPENFRMPFFAPNIQDFWRRWHMSLTSWLTDYLFTPLRMSLRRWGTWGLCLAILINMLAVGVWHGATWSFVVFGAINGIFMIVSVLTLKQRDAFFKGRPLLTLVRRFVGPLLIFHLIAFTLIFFRASNLTAGIDYVVHLIPGSVDQGVAALRFDLDELLLGLTRLLRIVFCVVLMESLHWVVSHATWRDRILSMPRAIRWAAYYIVILMVAIFVNFDTQNFIYAQF